MAETETEAKIDMKTGTETEMKTEADMKPKKAEQIKWDTALLAARQARARMTGLILAGFVVLFFLITVVRLGADAIKHPF